MAKRSGSSLLVVLVALVLAAYFYTQTYQGFQDASGNTTPSNSSNSWVGLVVFGVVLATFGFVIWMYVKLISGTASALSGIGSGVANWGKSKLQK